MRTRTRAVWAWMGLAGAMVGPAAGQDVLDTGVGIAVRMEAIAVTLHDHADRWADAAILYEAAAALRPEGDARAQKDLFTAAQLFLETKNVGRSIAALEAAAQRALASGEHELARERFADAAVVAQRAGLSREYQRLSYRTLEVATAEGLTRLGAGRSTADIEAARR